LWRYLRVVSILIYSAHCGPERELNFLSFLLFVVSRNGRTAYGINPHKLAHKPEINNQVSSHGYSQMRPFYLPPKPLEIKFFECYEETKEICINGSKWVIDHCQNVCIPPCLDSGEMDKGGNDYDNDPLNLCAAKKWSDRADRGCVCIRILGIITLWSVYMALVVGPMYSVFVRPVEPSLRNPNDYTYAPDFQCSTNVTVPSNWIDNSVFVDGCGGRGDHIADKSGHDSFDSTDRHIWMVFFHFAWLAIGCFGHCAFWNSYGAKRESRQCDGNRTLGPIAMLCLSLW
jgi:hypothetical protein